MNSTAKLCFSFLVCAGILAALDIGYLAFRYLIQPKGDKYNQSKVLNVRLEHPAYRIYYSGDANHRMGRPHSFDGTLTDIGPNAARIYFGFYNIGWPGQSFRVSCRDEREILFWRSTTEQDVLRRLLAAAHKSGWEQHRTNAHQLLLSNGADQVELSYLEYRGPLMHKLEVILCRSRKTAPLTPPD